MTAWWWVALAVLILNDHVLKGAGILPGWLTGKLSDFAGLVVAPMLAATLAGPRRPRARALAFALVVAAFAATKVTPSVARALEVVAAGVGVPSRIWPDPTDLLALAVVPFAWRLVTRGTRPLPLHRPALPFGSALRVSLSAIACVATSQVPPDQRVPSAAFLGNLTSDPVAVQVFRAREPVDCGGLTGPAGRTLDSSRFVPDVCLDLYAGEGRALGVPRPDGGQAPGCEAVVIRTAGLPDTLLTWGDIGAVKLDGSLLVAPRSLTGSAAVVQGALAEHVVFLERGAGRTFAAGTTLIASEPVVLPLPDRPSCGDAISPARDGGTLDGDGG